MGAVRGLMGLVVGFLLSWGGHGFVELGRRERVISCQIVSS